MVVNRIGHCLNNWSLEITLARFHKHFPQRHYKNIHLGFNSETEFNDLPEGDEQPSTGSYPESTDVYASINY